MVNLEVVNDLWLQIDKIHLSCLQTEESPQKIDQVRKLKGFMKEYLCLVTSNQRFYSPTTKAVLYNSILRRSEQFSPNRFRQAWEMLATYAANLLGQPWRKEFNEIRLYSGAYKYQIEQQLIGAEEILMEMGYTFDVEFNRLVVQGVLDYDRVVMSHRDCLLAEVESQILCEIHAAMSISPRPCSWASIFDFRDSYVGTVNHCVRGLMYQHAQKDNMAYNFNIPAPVSPYLGPHEMYPSAFPYQMIYQQCVKPTPYIYSSPSMRQNEIYLPKTLPGEETKLNSCSSGVIDARSPEDPNFQESFDVWNNTHDVKSIPKFESLLDMDRLEQLCYDDVDNFKSNNNSKSYERARITKEGKNCTQPLANDIPDGSLERSFDKVPLTTLKKSVKTAIPSPTGTRPKETISPNTKLTKAGETHKVNGWECLFCTFLNSEDREICDMCSKSKHRGSESQPLHRGGRECSNCTLVNAPDVEQCAACSTSLTNAPTYI